MLVKLLVSRSGADGAFNRGQEIEVSEAEAARMIEAGQCEPVRAEKRETAVARPRAEKAAR